MSPSRHPRFPQWVLLTAVLAATLPASAQNVTRGEAKSDATTTVIDFTHPPLTPEPPPPPPPATPVEDGDSNGLHDQWELTYFGQRGVDPAADADGDGLTNREEFEAQTDPLRPHPGWLYFALRPDLIPLTASPAGTALLRDQTHYWRWHDGELTRLGAYLAHPDSYGSIYAYTEAVINRRGDVAIQTIDMTETWPNYLDRRVETQTITRVYPIDGSATWEFAAVQVVAESDFTDQPFFDAQGNFARWALIIDMSNDLTDPVLGEDGSLWGVLPQGIYPVSDTTYEPNAQWEYFRYNLVRVPPGGGAAVTQVTDLVWFNAFLGLDGSGRPIGTRWMTVPDGVEIGFVGLGPNVVPYHPLAQSFAGRLISRDPATFALKLHETDGTVTPLPPNLYDSFFDSQERINGRRYADNGFEFYLLTPTGPSGAWREVAYRALPLPTGWASTHQISVGSEAAQLGYASINSAVAQPFLAIANPATLAVDANRDGEIHLPSEVLPADQRDITSADRPYRFWSNDDDDIGPANGDDIPGRPLNKADYNNAVVDSVRDLVDFFPVYLDIKQLLTVLPPSTSIKYKLKQADGALNFVYTNKTKARAFDYQKQILTTGFGPAFTQAAGVATTQRITAAGVELNTAFLDGIKNTDWGVVLIEGRVASDKPLVLAVEKDGTQIAEVAVNIKVRPVEQMFRHVDLTSFGKNYDGSGPSLPETPAATRTGEPTNWPDTQTNGKYFVFLHGYNVDAQKARGWQAEVFKRLHALGSKARFVGVTWHGATGLDYHRAVFHAFQTGDALADALSFTGNADVTIAAHSLGNMVVSHAIQAGGLSPARYYIINGATPLEAYAQGDADAGQANNMTELAWRTYDSRLSMANWHTLFAGTSDNRRSLTWKDLFVSVSQAQGLAHNFYSEEEEVVADADLNTSASVVATLLNQGFNVTFGAWKAQELVKGVDWSTSLVSVLMERGQAGWGFNRGWNILDNPTGPPGQSGPPISRRRTPAQTVAITNEELKTKPFFEAFLETNLISATATTASKKAGEARVRYDLFARAIPAMSNATAANYMLSLDDARNFPMHTRGKAEVNGPFPTNVRGDWRHSDFKDVGLPYVYPMYQAMIDRGGLNQ